jgi:hypothetical protein
MAVIKIAASYINPLQPSNTWVTNNHRYHIKNIDWWHIPPALFVQLALVVADVKIPLEEQAQVVGT